MKPVYLGLLATSLVLTLGVSLVASIFLLPTNGIKKQLVLLSFDINDQTNMPFWCDELSSILDEKDVKASIFIVGNVAERFPECTRNLSLNDKLDVGSKTYSSVALSNIQDYATQLSEVERGKQAVDSTGNIFSRSFKAPLGSTDENIYSLLNRTEILADFSYKDHYNKYHGGYYIWFNITSYEATSHDASFYHDLPTSDTPLVLNFDNNDSIETIRELISQFNANNIAFVNASDLTQIELTVRRGD